MRIDCNVAARIEWSFGLPCSRHLQPPLSVAALHLMMTATAPKPRPGAQRARAVSAGLAARPALPRSNGSPAEVFANFYLRVCSSRRHRPQPRPDRLKARSSCRGCLSPCLPIAGAVLLPDDPAAEEEGAGNAETWFSNLKENDRVVTIGGIYGVVTNVQRDAERVTIRVDEATGTKLTSEHVGDRPGADGRRTGRRRHERKQEHNHASVNVCGRTGIDEPRARPGGKS